MAAADVRRAARAGANLPVELADDLRFGWVGGTDLRDRARALVGVIAVFVQGSSALNVAECRPNRGALSCRWVSGTRRGSACSAKHAEAWPGEVVTSGE